MITEDYVSFEIAKLLKEKGLNEDSWFHYDADGDIVTRGYRLNMPEDIPAWTLQTAMKWLREVHNIQIGVSPYSALNKTWSYYMSKNFEPLTQRFYAFKTYEEACEAAIKYCLEKLI